MLARLEKCFHFRLAGGAGYLSGQCFFQEDKPVPVGDAVREGAFSAIFPGETKNVTFPYRVDRVEKGNSFSAGIPPGYYASALDFPEEFYAWIVRPKVGVVHRVLNDGAKVCHGQVVFPDGNRVGRWAVVVVRFDLQPFWEGALIE